MSSAGGATDYAALRAVTSLAGGLSAFGVIGYAQLEVLRELLEQRAAGVAPLASVGLAPKLFAVVLSFLAVSSAIAYTRSGRRRLALVNRVGMIWAIAAVLWCFVPMRWLVGAVSGG